VVMAFRRKEGVLPNIKEEEYDSEDDFSNDAPSSPVSDSILTTSEESDSDHENTQNTLKIPAAKIDKILKDLEKEWETLRYNSINANLLTNYSLVNLNTHTNTKIRELHQLFSPLFKAVKDEIEYDKKLLELQAAYDKTGGYFSSNNRQARESLNQALKEAEKPLEDVLKKIEEKMDTWKEREALSMVIAETPAVRFKLRWEGWLKANDLSTPDAKKQLDALYKEAQSKVDTRSSNSKYSGKINPTKERIEVESLYKKESALIDLAQKPTNKQQNKL
jgi:hypothetical protein